MSAWRDVLGVGNDTADFDAVHQRFRELVLNSSHSLDLERLKALNGALDDAEQELCGSGPVPTDRLVVYLY